MVCGPGKGSTMARVVLESLTAGMRLNKPVFNLNGVLLLRAGEVLTVKHLEIFKVWGVREADVVREDGGEPELTPEATASPEILAAAQREIARRFRGCGACGSAQKNCRPALRSSRLRSSPTAIAPTAIVLAATVPAAIVPAAIAAAASSWLRADLTWQARVLTFNVCRPSPR